MPRKKPKWYGTIAWMQWKDRCAVYIDGELCAVTDPGENRITTWQWLNLVAYPKGARRRQLRCVAFVTNAPTIAWNLDEMDTTELEQNG